MTGLDLAILSMATAATVGVVQVAKQAGLPDRFAGIAALGVGIVLGVVLAFIGIGDTSVVAGGVAGFFAGLSAAGVWSGTKAAIAG